MPTAKKESKSKQHDPKAVCGTCYKFHVVKGVESLVKMCHGVKDQIRRMYAPETCKRHPDYYLKED